MFSRSGQVDLYLGIFTLDYKAQFVLCNTLLVISLGLLFMLSVLYKFMLQETKYK